MINQHFKQLHKKQKTNYDKMVSNCSSISFWNQMQIKNASESKTSSVSCCFYKVVSAYISEYGLHQRCNDKIGQIDMIHKKETTFFE